jgi:hypothetical protein
MKHGVFHPIAVPSVRAEKCSAYYMHSDGRLLLSRDKTIHSTHNDGRTGWLTFLLAVVPS